MLPTQVVCLHEGPNYQYVQLIATYLHLHRYIILGFSVASEHIDMSEGKLRVSCHRIRPVLYRVTRVGVCNQTKIGISLASVYRYLR